MYFRDIESDPMKAAQHNTQQRLRAQTRMAEVSALRSVRKAEKKRGKNRAG